MTARGLAIPGLFAGRRSFDPEGSDAQVLTHAAAHLSHGGAALLDEGPVLGGTDYDPAGIGVAHPTQAVKRLVPGRDDERRSHEPELLADRVQSGSTEGFAHCRITRRLGHVIAQGNSPYLFPASLRVEAYSVYTARRTSSA
ncbi:hypothetical protein [Streptomyces clavifer]|uniref:hypothetical protein n=1 Tax=Streptomyces clavifer TaxID=68188 RepID=UPI0037F47219